LFYSAGGISILYVISFIIFGLKQWENAVLESLKKICPTATFFTTIPPVGFPRMKAQDTRQPTPTTLTSLHWKDMENVVGDDLANLCDEVW
jgi:hypothetical protein